MKGYEKMGMYSGKHRWLVLLLEKIMHEMSSAMDRGTLQFTKQCEDEIAKRVTKKLPTPTLKDAMVAYSLATT